MSREREPAEGSQPFHSRQAGIGDLGEIEVEMRQCLAPFQLYQPVVGDLGATEVEDFKGGELLQVR